MTAYDDIPAHWEVKWAEAGYAYLDLLLADGWEPFAVWDGYVYLRRYVEPLPPVPEGL